MTMTGTIAAPALPAAAPDIRKDSRVILYCFAAFALSPFVPKVGTMFLWQFLVPLILVFYAPLLFRTIGANQFFLIFAAYVAVHTAYNVLLAEEPHAVEAATRVVLFFMVFAVFCLTYSPRYWGKEALGELERIAALLLIASAVVSAYQFLLRPISTDLALSYNQRFRRITPWFYQSTGFFYEPRFFSLFLNWELYIFLFVSTNKKRLLYALLAIVLILTTVSIGGYAAMVALVGAYLLRIYAGAIKNLFRLEKKLFALGLIALLVIAIAIGGLATSKFARRFESVGASLEAVDYETLFLLAYKYNYAPTAKGVILGQSVRANSAFRSVIGEISFILKTLREAPIFGFGINRITRIVSLNTHTEVIYRWGLAGYALFIALIIKARGKIDFPFIVFFVFWFSIDGAIAKPLYWMSLGMLLAFERLAREHTLPGPQR